MTVLDAFASEVGPVASGPVTCVGGRTQWTVGGPPDSMGREVAAPSGVVAHEPGEMIVRVRAGTTLGELSDATAVGGQYVACEADDPAQATIGGVLACGLSGVRRLGWGPLRDAVLEVTAVSAGGQLVRAGAPLVKNVTGFDLCRLLVGSLGTLGFVAEVVLRCQPRPETEKWWCSEAGSQVDPFALAGGLYRPLSVLWDGDRVWVGLSGYSVDVDEQFRTVLRSAGGFVEVEGPPPRPDGDRCSLAPDQLRELPASAAGARWLAQVGVGVVHWERPVGGAESGVLEPGVVQPGVVELHRRIKARFDPTGRMNPGRSPLRLRAAAS